MSTRTRVLQILLTLAVAGLGGFWGGYAWNYRDVLELFGTFEQGAEIRMADLAYAFAPPDQVKLLIEREPAPGGEWAHTAKRVELLRKLRLAVVTGTEAERSRLLEEARALCEGCKPESLQRMLEVYAQRRLVPPGDDLACDACKPAGRRRALPPASDGPKGAKPYKRLEPAVSGVLEGRFRGKGSASRVLFFDDHAVVHAWDENGVAKREPISTDIPPGQRECKALRSRDSQDFLLCLYWYTGPGGGRVDGLLFDLRRRIVGEFFSAAININLEGTLCFPDSMLGPMPSYGIVEWETRAASLAEPAEVRVEVAKEGWSSREAEALRAQPATKKYCKCFEGDECSGVAPTPPTETSTIVFRLTNDQLHPSEESKQVLAEIGQQWGHHALMKAWNLEMRGF